MILNFEAVESVLASSSETDMLFPTGTSPKLILSGNTFVYFSSSLQVALQVMLVYGRLESLQVMTSFLLTLPLYFPVLKVRSIYELSPGGITIPVFFEVVHPQGALILLIVRVSIPLLYTVKL